MSGPTKNSQSKRGQLGCARSSECSSLHAAASHVPISGQRDHSYTVTYQRVTSRLLETSSPNRLLMQQNATREHVHPLTAHARIQTHSKPSTVSLRLYMHTSITELILKFTFPAQTDFASCRSINEDRRFRSGYSIRI